MEKSEIKVVPCPHECIYWVDEEGRKFHHEKCPANGTAARPVETRPPAPTVQVSHEQNHETVNAKGYAEQAAPPRPLEILCSFCGKPMSLYWHENLEDAIACREKVEAGLPAPAAIEQARPQTPEFCRHCLQTRIPIDVRLTLERERTKVCDGVNAIKKALHSRSWLTEGRGSYTYDDDRWMDEFALAIQEIQTALVPLERIAGDHSNCPIETSEVIEARKPIARAASGPAPERTPPGFQEDWLVWSVEHHLWWKPNACGYTTHIAEAGRYTLEQAIIHANCRWSGKPFPDEVIVPSPELIERLSVRAVAVPEPAKWWCEECDALWILMNGKPEPARPESNNE